MPRIWLWDSSFRVAATWRSTIGKVNSTFWRKPPPDPTKERLFLGRMHPHQRRVEMPRMAEHGEPDPTCPDLRPRSAARQTLPRQANVRQAVTVGVAIVLHPSRPGQARGPDAGICPPKSSPSSSPLWRDKRCAAGNDGEARIRRRQLHLSPELAPPTIHRRHPGMPRCHRRPPRSRRCALPPGRALAEG